MSQPWPASFAFFLIFSPRATRLLGAGGLPDGRGEQSPGEVILEGLRRATGFGDAELLVAAKELLELPAPRQRLLWQRSVPHCEPGTCAGEVLARLMAALGESEKLPLRSFEPFPGDPIYDLWKAEDKKQSFHSWVDNQDVPDSAPLWSLMPPGQPFVVGRAQAAEFMRIAKARILRLTDARAPADLGRCIEWDDPFYSVRIFGPLCKRYDVLTYADKAAGREEGIRNFPQGTRIIAADILALPKWFPRDYGIVICLFVLEHVTDPHRAVRGAIRALLPGGFLLLGAPFVDGIHACPADYFRYTPAGLRRLVEDVGLEVLLEFSPGSPAISAGDLLGMKSSYWSDQGLFTNSDTHPTNVFLLARKLGRHPFGPTRRNESS